MATAPTIKFARYRHVNAGDRFIDDSKPLHNSKGAPQMHAARRAALLILLVCAASVYLSCTFVLSYTHHSSDSIQNSSFEDESTNNSKELFTDFYQEMLTGEASAPEIENEILRAELGQAAWKLLHTTVEKFPEEPSAEDSDALRAYLYLFARLYPCGECARHFQGLIAKFPPQVSSRTSAANWACHVHNEVNKSLGKLVFDCETIGEVYDCGCGNDRDESETLGVI